jgi:hypothetical protein
MYLSINKVKKGMYYEKIHPLILFSLNDVHKPSKLCHASPNKVPLRRIPQYNDPPDPRGACYVRAQYFGPIGDPGDWTQAYCYENMTEEECRKKAKHLKGAIASFYLGWRIGEHCSEKRLKT